MRRRSLLFPIASILAILTLFSIYHLVRVFALRPIGTFISSAKGGSPPDVCADSATPFLAALTGSVATDASCTDFNQSTYPSHQMILAPSDQSFSLTVTPVLWGNGSTDRATILHLAFSSSNPTLSLSSFVIGGLVISPALGSAPDSPGNVACSLNLNPPGPLYALVTPFDNISVSPPPPTTVCTNASLTFNDNAAHVVTVEPTPIQFADGNTTRWDITGISGSSVISSQDLIVPGYPSDLVDSNPIDVDGGASTPSNNLTQAFMNSSNFLAVAVDTSNGKIETAGGLKIPSVTAPLTNDGISSAMNVDPNAAISTGFTTQINASTATPQQDAAGNLIKAPSPADPILPGTCFNQGGGNAQLLRTVWFSYTPIGDGSVTIDTAGSRYDTVLGMFTGTPGNLTLVNGACSDDFLDQSQALHLQAELQSVTVTHGTPYFVLIGESPTENGTQNNSDGTPTNPPVTVAQPLSNDATLFLSLIEAPTPPGITLAPVPNTALSFGSQVVGTPSSAQIITVTSTGGTPISISNVSSPTGFSASGCTSPVPQGSSCQISVVFQPSTTGTIAGNLTFMDNVSGTARVYPLSGSGSDFSFPQPSQSGSSGTLSSTSPATFALTVSGSAGFSGSISFACQNLPTNTQCSFSPNVATPGSGGSNSVTLTVSRISTATALSHKSSVTTSVAVLSAACLGLFVLTIGQKKQLALRLLLVCASLVALSTLGGCGGGSSPPPPPSLQPPPGSYPFVVNATVPGGTPKGINLTLVVD